MAHSGGMQPASNVSPDPAAAVLAPADPASAGPASADPVARIAEPAEGLTPAQDAHGVVRPDRWGAVLSVLGAVGAGAVLRRIRRR